MATTAIMTFQDACELLWHMFNPAIKPPTGRELNAARNAVLRAYRDLPQQHHWSYYVRRGLVTTSASQTAGTVTYDHTGGTYERMLTIAGSTWPTDAALGSVKISGTLYSVEDRKSNTTIITLSVNTNPGADVTAGSSYTWMRDSYPLPINFRRVLSLGETGTGSAWYPLDYLSPQQFQDTVLSEGGTADRPNYYTIRSSGDYIGAMEIVFGKAPNAARSYDLLYESQPNELKTYKYATGTVSVSSSSTTVTGSGTAFDAVHVGSIIRFSSNSSSEPTGAAGNVDGTCNPSLAQRTITAVASATSLTVDSSVSATALSGVKYVISDPIDIEPIVMRTAFETLCMANYSLVQKREDFKDLQSQAMHELVLAMGNDSRTVQARSGAHQETFRSAIGEVSVV